jgi:hypothetical protein
VRILERNIRRAMGKLFAVKPAALLALGLAVGCGGRTLVAQESDTGPLATCGNSCSLDQAAASCSATCEKIEQAACLGANDPRCPMDCTDLVSMTPACAVPVYAFLRCIEPQQPTCSASGSIQFVGCDSEQQAVAGCFADAGEVAVTTPTSPSLPSPPAPPSSPGIIGGSTSVCPGIPQPVGLSGCFGGGGGGPNGPVTCNASCEDSVGNVWEGDCAGSTCTCKYNGGSPCTCTMADSGALCGSCCPGTAFDGGP